MKERKLSVVILLLIIALLGGYITYDKLLNNTNDKCIEETNKVKDNEEQILSLGLSMYRYANGLETLFHKIDNNVITNYENVAIFFTDNFISNAKNGNMCWPTKKDLLYYSNDDCSAGGTTSYKYKEINVKEYNDNKIIYTISINKATTLLDDTDKFKTEEEVINEDFEIILQDSMWKINKFIYNNQPVLFD